MEVITKKYEAKIDELQDVLDSNEENLMMRGAKMKNVMAINVAVEEIFVNVCYYAYEGIENKGVEISCSFDDDVEKITFIDEGIPFNPLERRDPDVNISAEERNIGGLGIYMVKKTMDKCDYERKDGKNIFSISKNFKA